jgi:chromosome partitioning protein
MPVIVVANEKGGVGKSTVAANLAVGLAMKFILHNPKNPGRVLLIDLDPQMHAINKIIPQGMHVASPVESIAGLMAQPSPPSIKRYVRKAGFELDNLYFIPGNEAGMKEVARRLPALPGADMRLVNLVDQVTDEYEFIIIDTPPNAGVMLNNALLAATHLLIPIEVSIQGASGLGSLENTAGDILSAHARWKSINPKEYILGYLPNRYDEQATDAQMVMKRTEEQFKEKVFPVIHEARDLTKANGAGMSIFHYKPPRSYDDGQIASSARASQEMERLVDEVLRRCGYGQLVKA